MELFSSKLTALPVEILQLILWQLPPADLKSAVLVCRRLARAGETPALWSWAEVDLSCDDMEQKFASGRLQLVTTIRLNWNKYKEVYLDRKLSYRTRLTEKLLAGLSGLSCLRRVIGWEEIDLDNVQDDQISKIVSKVMEISYINFDHTDTCKNIHKILLAISNLSSPGERNSTKNSSLEDLKIGAHKCLDPELLAQAVVKVKNVEVHLDPRFDITHYFKCLRKIFELSDDRSTLESFTIRETKMPIPSFLYEIARRLFKNISPEVFGEAVNRLKYLNLGNMELMKDHQAAVLQGLLAGKSKLQWLSDSCFDTKIIAKHFTRVKDCRGQSGLQFSSELL